MNETQKGEAMNSKLFKTFSLLLGGMIVFTSCDDDPAPVHNGDVVGTWNLSGLEGTYNRKVVTGSGIEILLIPTIWLLPGMMRQVLQQQPVMTLHSSLALQIKPWLNGPLATTRRVSH